jgi:urea transporter
MQQQTIAESTSMWTGIFNTLTESGASTALIFGMLLGLGFALFVKIPVHRKVEDDLMAGWWCYTACIVGGFVALHLLWPPIPWRPRLAFCLSIAFATPLLWFLLGKLIGLVRPAWEKSLALHRFSIEAPPEAPKPDAP